MCTDDSGRLVGVISLSDIAQRGGDGVAKTMRDVLFMENVGNLVCPALFDLGEHARVALMSVTESEDEPLKYPHVFHSADLVVLTKLDRAPVVGFNMEGWLANLEAVNGDVSVIALSARDGTGIESWCQWIEAQVEPARVCHDDTSGGGAAPAEPDVIARMLASIERLRIEVAARLGPVSLPAVGALVTEEILSSYVQGIHRLLEHALALPGVRDELAKRLATDDVLRALFVFHGRHPVAREDEDVVSLSLADVGLRPRQGDGGAPRARWREPRRTCRISKRRAAVAQSLVEAEPLSLVRARWRLDAGAPASPRGGVRPRPATCAARKTASASART
jgi:hypothetical protein